MSSFMCSKETFQRIAITLAHIPESRYFLEELRPGLQTNKEIIESLVIDWYTANRMTVVSRYGDKIAVKPTFLKSLYSNLTNVPMVQGMKSAQCLAYQISGDVPAEHQAVHDKAEHELKLVVGYIAKKIVEESKEYNDAHWG
jgi:hypothetical protein